MSRRRFVFDTNTIVSAALLANSIPRQAFEFAIAQGELLLSDTVQLELSEVLRRTKFDKYVTEEKRLRFMAGLWNSYLDGSRISARIRRNSTIRSR
jgi:uncharacterized protein